MASPLTPPVQKATSGAADEAAAGATVAAYLADRQWFLAYDAARNSPWFDNSLTLKQGAARALLRLGAVEEAKKILEPLCPQLDVQSAELAQLYTVARSATDKLLGSPALPPSPQSLEAFAELLGAVARAREALGAAQASDEETLGLLASAYKDDWKESGALSDARRCREMYLRTYNLTGGYWTCINAATMSWVVAHLLRGRGKPDKARAEAELTVRLAGQTLGICERELPRAEGEQRFWLLVTAGEARLHLGDETRAADDYAKAAEVARLERQKDNGRRSQGWVVSAAGQLRMLQGLGFPVPAKILEGLKLPTVVVFAGHMIDRPERPHPRFTPDMEGAVRQMIDQELEKLDAGIGYCSAACGSDLLFVEAMQDREGEVNIVLPFNDDDFIAESVAHAGQQWVRRFRRALKLAGESVTYATQEPFLGTRELFGYNDRIIQSLAGLRARFAGHHAPPAGGLRRRLPAAGRRHRRHHLPLARPQPAGGDPPPPPRRRRAVPRRGADLAAATAGQSRHPVGRPPGHPHACCSPTWSASASSRRSTSRSSCTRS